MVPEESPSSDRRLGNTSRKGSSFFLFRFHLRTPRCCSLTFKKYATCTLILGLQLYRDGGISIAVVLRWRCSGKRGFAKLGNSISNGRKWTPESNVALESDSELESRVFFNMKICHASHLVYLKSYVWTAKCHYLILGGFCAVTREGGRTAFILASRI